MVLIDAAEGPMPQTRFVLSKARELCASNSLLSTRSTVPRSIEKVLRKALDCCSTWGGEQFMDEFIHIYSSSKEGFATHDPEVRGRFD